MTERLIDPGQKILRHPEVLAALRRGERVWPLHVELDPSNACNKRCRHCDFAYVHDGAQMPLALATRILGELAEVGVRAVTVTGGGEPTVNPHFAEIVQAAARLGLKVGLYTNGLLAERILAAGPSLTWAYLSVDAASPEGYLAQTGVDGFWRVLDTARRLLEAREADNPTVGLGFLLGSGNWRDAPEMAALSESVGADYCQFRPMVEPEADYGWARDAVTLLDTLAGPRVYVSRARFLELYQRTPRHYHLCRASELVPCIGADGTLWVCVNTRGLRSLGSLADHSFRELWEARSQQWVGPDCRVACRDHALNATLEYVCGEGAHDAFV